MPSLQEKQLSSASWNLDLNVESQVELVPKKAPVLPMRPYAFPKGSVGMSQQPTSPFAHNEAGAAVTNTSWVSSQTHEPGISNVESQTTSSADSFARPSTCGDMFGSYCTADTLPSEPNDLTIAGFPYRRSGKRRQPVPEKIESAKRARNSENKHDIENCSFIQCWVLANPNKRPSPDQLDAFEIVTGKPYKAIHRWFESRSTQQLHSRTENIASQESLLRKWTEDHPPELIDPDTIDALKTLTGIECFDIYRCIYSFYDQCQWGSISQPDIDIPATADSGAELEQHHLFLGHRHSFDSAPNNLETEAVSFDAAAKKRSLEVRKCSAKKSPVELGHNMQKPWDKEKRYSCVHGCGGTWKNKCDWLRHDNQSYPQYAWICNLGRALDVGRGEKKCTAKSCETSANDDKNHWDTDHDGLVPCSEKQLKCGKGGRIFFRDAHFKQHMETFHSHIRVDEQFLDKHRYQTGNMSFPIRCGFCGYSWVNYEDRIKHLAQHFEHGASLQIWRDPWPDSSEDEDLAQDYEGRGSHIEVQTDSKADKNQDEEDADEEDEDDKNNEGKDEDEDSDQDDDDDDDDDHADNGNGGGQGNSASGPPDYSSSDDVLDQYFPDGGGGGAGSYPSQMFPDFDFACALLALRDAVCGLQETLGSSLETQRRLASATLATWVHSSLSQSAASVWVFRKDPSEYRLVAAKFLRTELSIKKMIGFGAVANVRKAVFKRPSLRVVALKRMRMSLDWPKQLRETVAQVTSLVLEYFVMVTMEHPHITKGYGLILLSARFGLLMPLAYSDLQQILEHGHETKTILSHAYEDFNCLLSALSSLHIARIVHGDIKPANILAYRGQRGDFTFKLSDFGCCTLDGATYACSAGFSSEKKFFTRRYAAPEQINNISKSGIGAAVDVWSLGCVFFEVVIWLHGFPIEKINHFPPAPEQERLFSTLYGTKEIGFTIEQIAAIRAMRSTSPEHRPQASQMRQYFPSKYCCQPLDTIMPTEICDTTVQADIDSGSPLHAQYQYNDNDVKSALADTELKCAALPQKSDEDRREAINHGVKPSGKVSSVSDPRIPTLLKALFFYNPLKEHQEIRLIDIFPANDLDSPIHCSVLHVNLLRPCHYEALSYVWGDPQIGDEIDIDGQRFPITKNLGKALRQIRRPTAKTRLWADAICINQEDPKERSCQVSLMSRIYRSASRVTVFLEEINGDGVDMQQLLESMSHFWSSNITINKGRFSNLSLLKFHSEHEIGFGYYAFDRVLKSRWWSRGWTLQEIVMAKSVRFISEGSKTDKTGNPQRESEHYDTRYKRHSAQISRPILWEKISLISFLRIRLRQLPLLELLERLRGYECSDPRDKVYALLGLASDTEKLKLFPDYTKSSQEVFVDVTRSMIKYLGNVDVLCYAQRLPRSWDGLPSWVPDWTQPRDCLPLKSNNFRATRDSRCCYLDKSLSVEYRLHIACIFADSILQLHRSPWLSRDWPPSEKLLDSEKERALRIGKSIFVELDRWMGFIDSAWKYTRKPHLMQAILSAWACAGLSLNERGRWVKHKYSPKVYRSVKFGHNLSRASELYCASVALRLGTRKPFVTQYGDVGVGPRLARPGDLVAIFPGASIPFVVRKVSSEEYGLVGECYVHGLMDGEAMDLGKEFVDIFLV